MSYKGGDIRSNPDSDKPIDFVCPHCKQNQIDYLADVFWNSSEQHWDHEACGDFRCNNDACEYRDQDITPEEVEL